MSRASIESSNTRNSVTALCIAATSRGALDDHFLLPVVGAAVELLDDVPHRYRLQPDGRGCSLECLRDVLRDLGQVCPPDGVGGLPGGGEGVVLGADGGGTPVAVAVWQCD